MLGVFVVVVDCGVTESKGMELAGLDNEPISLRLVTETSQLVFHVRVQSRIKWLN